jgi:hypothetical protein
VLGNKGNAFVVKLRKNRRILTMKKRGALQVEVPPVSFILVRLLLHENLLHAIASLHDDDAAFGLLQTHT